MDRKKASRDESKGMEKNEHHERKAKRDESRGMKMAMDKHNRLKRDHHEADDKHLESQKSSCDRSKGIDRVLQKGKGPKGQGGKMHAGGDESNWSRGDKKLTPRSA